MDQKQKKRLIIIVMVGVVLILITAFGVPKLAGNDGVRGETAPYKWAYDIYLGPVMTGPLSLFCKAQNGMWRITEWRDHVGVLTGRVTGTCLLPYPDAGMDCTDSSQCNGRCNRLGGPCNDSEACLGICSENEIGKLCEYAYVVEDGKAVTRQFGYCGPFPG